MSTTSARELQRLLDEAPFVRSLAQALAARDADEVVQGTWLRAMQSGAGARARNISASEVSRCRELIALNSVRGARPVLELDGKPVGDGRPGPRAAELDSILAKA